MMAGRKYLWIWDDPHWSQLAIYSHLYLFAYAHICIMHIHIQYTYIYAFIYVHDIHTYTYICIYIYMMYVYVCVSTFGSGSSQCVEVCWWMHGIPGAWLAMATPGTVVLMASSEGGLDVGWVFFMGEWMKIVGNTKYFLLFVMVCGFSFRVKNLDFSVNTSTSFAYT